MLLAQELVEEVMELIVPIAQHKQLQVQLERGPSIALHTDPDMLGFILRNTAFNAVKHTPKGGSVILSLSANEDGATIVVKDEGEGMSSEVLEMLKLGKRHTSLGTAGEKGSGLGLQLSHVFCEKLGFEMEWHSDLNSGALVRIKIPGHVVKEVLPNVAGTPGF